MRELVTAMHDAARGRVVFAPVHPGDYEVTIRRGFSSAEGSEIEPLTDGVAATVAAGRTTRASLRP